MNRDGLLSWVAAAVCILVVSACGSLEIVVTGPPAVPSTSTGSFRAGAARVDVTPPPGLPPAGYSLGYDHARFAGHRTRLYVRAVVLEDAGGERVALVVADLGLPSSLLHRRVAERVAATTGITADRLLLSVTHTHSAPSGYFGNAFFNRFASPGLTTGFDARLYAFLADRVAAAVEQAAGALAPAALRFGRREVPNLTRNRSLDAFRANHGAPRDAPSLLDASLDRSLGVLRVDAATGETVAALLFFAGHPTVLGNDNDLWHADVVGVATQRLEARLRDGEHRPVVALFNGAEGDVSYAWNAQTHDEAVRLARWLEDVAAATLADLDDVPAMADPTIDRRYEETPVPGADVGERRRLAHTPRIGCAVMTGAEDGPTGVPSFIAHEGMRRKVARGEHGHKPLALGPIQGLVLDESSGPTIASTQLLRIGAVHLVGLCVEPTTEFGRRVRRAVRRGLEDDDAIVLIVGLANAYLYYCATPEEYDRQHYEGAATLYGRHTATFFQQRAGLLAESLRRGGEFGASAPGERCYRVGRDAARFPEPLDRDPADTTRRVRSIEPGWDRCEIEWQDVDAGRIAIDAGWLVRVEVRSTDGSWAPLLVDGEIESDLGLNFAVRRHGDRRTFTVWRATWFYPAGLDVEREHRLVIAPRAGKGRLASAAFRVPPSPPSPR